MRAKKGLLALDEPVRELGCIKRRKNSKKLYIDFYYFGHRIVRSTELDDTPANERKVKAFLVRAAERIEQGTFKFAEAFSGASEELKAFFTTLEGREYLPEPHHVKFGEYTKEWMKTVVPSFTSKSKQRDFNLALNARILPYFKDMTFHQITGQEVFKFTEVLVNSKGVKKGQPFSRARKINLLIPLRAIWNDACDQHRWVLRSPFDNLHKKLEKTEKKSHAVIRFAQWQLFIDSLEQYYRPIAELMILTGMIISEMGGLALDDIDGDYICLNRSFILGEEKTKLKTAFRKRKIFITESIRQRLDILMKRATSDYLVTHANGNRFESTEFAKVWRKAVQNAGIQPMSSYSARHTFAAWSLTIGINPLRLFGLMGHASKQMVFEVYGDYVEGLEEDAESIMEYFGKDFVLPRKNKSPAPSRDSTGDSFSVVALTS